MMKAEKKVECANCAHFREAPEEAPYTGCWHPDHMRQRQTDRFLKQQELPGDHRKINLRGDCPQYEPRPKKPSFWQRMLAGEF
jgi:hypothetical protein